MPVETPDELPTGTRVTLERSYLKSQNIRLPVEVRMPS